MDDGNDDIFQAMDKMHLQVGQGDTTTQAGPVHGQQPMSVTQGQTQSVSSNIWGPPQQQQHGNVPSTIAPLGQSRSQQGNIAGGQNVSVSLHSANVSQNVGMAGNLSGLHQTVALTQQGSMPSNILPSGPIGSQPGNIGVGQNVSGYVHSGNVAQNVGMAGNLSGLGQNIGLTQQGSMPSNIYGLTQSGQFGPNIPLVSTRSGIATTSLADVTLYSGIHTQYGIPVVYNPNQPPPQTRATTINTLAPSMSLSQQRVAFTGTTTALGRPIMGTGDQRNIRSAPFQTTVGANTSFGRPTHGSSQSLRHWNTGISGTYRGGQQPRNSSGVGQLSSRRRQNLHPLAERHAALILQCTVRPGGSG